MVSWMDPSFPPKQLTGFSSTCTTERLEAMPINKFLQMLSEPQSLCTVKQTSYAPSDGKVCSGCLSALNALSPKDQFQVVGNPMD